MNAFRWIPAVLTCLVLGLAAVGARAAEGPTRFYGHAYDLDTGRYLYTEVHEQRLEGGRWLGGSIRYFGPDGRLWGTKTLDFSADPYIPVYRFEMPGQGYAEAITRVDAKSVELSKAVKGAAAATETLTRKDPMAADSSFHSFLRSRFAELMAGQTLSFHFVAAGNLDSYRFRARRIEDTRFEDKPAVRFQVEADSLLRLVAPTLEVTYDPDQQRLLEYRGPSNVLDPATGKVFPKARIAYPSHPPADAPSPLPPLE